MDNYKKEQSGIYNVTFGNENATPILKDIEAIEDAVIEYIAMYVKGWHNVRRDKGVGAEHIKLHLEKGSKGEISLEELLNIGHSLRAYLKNFDEPFIDKNGAKIYEWENKEGIRFRVVTDKYKEEGHSNTPLSPFAPAIITFYSDRNVNKQMDFKNPKVEEYYQQQALQNTQTSNKKNIFSKNPKSTQETQERLRVKMGLLAKKHKQEKAISNQFNIVKDDSNKSNKDR